MFGNFGGGSAAGAFTATQAAVPAPQAPAPVPAPAPPPEMIYCAVARCQVFGDDRDSLLARWNLLQASWGQGRVFYNSFSPPAALDQTNPFCRFKALAYSLLPENAPDSFNFSLVIKQKPSELERPAGGPGGVAGGDDSARIVHENELACVLFSKFRSDGAPSHRVWGFAGPGQPAQPQGRRGLGQVL